jgi:hypothetical protein
LQMLFNVNCWCISFFCNNVKTNPHQMHFLLHISMCLFLFFFQMFLTI